MILSLNNKNNITLCGMMGSGKSSVGKMLAKKINFNFIDTDKLIEKKVGKSISEIFDEYGENKFRKIEQTIICDILKNKKIVVSLGGGAIINSKTSEIINKNSFSIYLNVKIDILKKRLRNSRNRPLIFGKDLDQTLTELLKKREKFYKKTDLIITNEKNINETVNNIIKNIIL